MLDYTFIDTYIAAIKFGKNADAEQQMAEFMSFMREHCLPVRSWIVKNPYSKEDIYNVRITFSKYRPEGYTGNDTTNLQPAPLKSYKVFFKSLNLLAKGKFSSSSELEDNIVITPKQIDITKQTLVYSSPDKYINSLLKIPVTGRYKAIRQNNCYYNYFPKNNYKRISNFTEVVRIYDKSSEIKNTTNIREPIILKTKPSQHSIEQFGYSYNISKNSLNILETRIMRAEISLKERQINKFCKFINISKFNLVQYLSDAIENGTFYDTLNGFFSDFMKNRFNIPEIPELKNKPLELFKYCYINEGNTMLKDYIYGKAVNSPTTKNIVVSSENLAIGLINKLINDYKPPI